MDKVVRTVHEDSDDATIGARREWLVANGLGGFASAIVAGEITRRYHGFLIAALPAPLGRIVMLNDLIVEIERADGSAVDVRAAGRFLDFSMDLDLPSWRYEIDGRILEKSVLMPARHNIVHISFRLLGGADKVRLRLRPFINFRPLEAPVSEPVAKDYSLRVQGRRYEVTGDPDLPTLRIMMSGCEGATFVADGEAERGYDSRGWEWTPGYFCADVRPDTAVTLIAGTEEWHQILAMTPDRAREFETERRRRLVAQTSAPAREGLGPELVLAADAFLITPVGRVADMPAPTRKETTSAR